MVAIMSRKTYHVDAYQSDKWWSLQVQEMPNAMSQVKSLDQADEWIREAINIVSDEPEDSFDVVIIPVVGKELEAALGFGDEDDDDVNNRVNSSNPIDPDLS
jgi:predicted RNase H-like HicB family nuclease